MLEIKNLSVKIVSEQGEIKPIDGIDLNISKGEIVGLVGESGCGKTMTALSIIKLLPSSARVIAGSILFNNRNVIELSESEIHKIRGLKISMIFQEPFSCLNPVVKVGQQISDVIMAHSKFNKYDARQKTLYFLERVNLKPAERIFESYPHQLSGGERQRVVVAMAVSLGPELLIADEPTTALDVSIQSDLLKLLLSLKNEFKLSILFITHDLRLIKKIADRIYVMYLGKIVEEAKNIDFFEQPLHPYSIGLLNSLPEGKERGKPLIAIKEVPSDLLHVSSGCSFHPRCFLVEEECRTKKQNLIQKGDRRVRCWKAV